MRGLLLLALLSPGPAAAADVPAEPAASLGEALKQGTLSLSLRYRFESVFDDGFDDPGFASVLQTQVGYRTRPWKGFSARVEFSNVADLGAATLHDDRGFAASGNGVSDRPPIADPELTRVNQVAMAFETGATRIEAGRIAIRLDDERFVGPVGWRQNTQSFSAVRIVDRSISRTALSYAFLERAWTVTGAERPMAGHLVDVAVELPIGTAVAHAYLLDFERVADAPLSTASFGVRLAGRREVGRLGVSYAAAYARQRDHASNPSRVRADYYRIDAGIGVPRLRVEAGFEVLGASPDGGRFTTPLATLHAFNGWADRFSNTPPGGLRDLWAGLRGDAGRFAWRVLFHDFRADAGGAGYGRELDLLATWTAPWQQQFGLKAARYDAREFSEDTTKLWLWSGWSF